jgi:hypothetical protein
MEIILVLPSQDTSDEDLVENCPLRLGLGASENLVEVVIFNVTMGIWMANSDSIQKYLHGSTTILPNVIKNLLFNHFLLTDVIG